MAINATASNNTLPTGSNSSVANKASADKKDEQNTEISNASNNTAEKTASTDPNSLASILGKSSASTAMPQNSGAGGMIASAAMSALGAIMQAFSGAEEASEGEEESSSKDKKGFNKEYSMSEANAEAMQEHDGSFSVDQIQTEEEIL